jgi:hypothetical protein
MPRQVSEQQLKERIGSALVVVVGRVREVRRPAGTEAQAQGCVGARITEHDPGIAEAVIEVTEGIKGTERGKEIVIRFPTSQDVMWYAYPKLQAGDAGVYFLEPDRLGPGTKALLRGAEVPAFNLRRRDDVLPVAESARVRAVSEQWRRETPSR